MAFAVVICPNTQNLVWSCCCHGECMIWTCQLIGVNGVRAAGKGSCEKEWARLERDGQNALDLKLKASLNCNEKLWGVVKSSPGVSKIICYPSFVIPNFPRLMLLRDLVEWFVAFPGAARSCLRVSSACSRQ